VTLKNTETGIFTVDPCAEGMKGVEGRDRVCRECADYLRDESNVRADGVDSLFFPRSVENISFILQTAAAHGIPVTVSGARTGICAGAVPSCGGYLVSLEKMARIISVKKKGGEFVLSAESGVRLSEIANALRTKELGPADVCEEFLVSKKRYFYPPDPTETTATIGGTVATNASGARTFYFGPTRAYVCGMEVVLPNGEVLRIRRGDIREKNGVFRVQKQKGRPLVIPAPRYEIPRTKHSAGLFSAPSMDLIDLFIGSEGILGIITGVSVRLVEEPGMIYGSVAFFRGEGDALMFVQRARQERKKPLALEYFDREALLLLNRAHSQQGPTSEIPDIEELGAAVYFESVITGHDSANESIRKDLCRWEELIRDSGGDPSRAWGALTLRDNMRLKSFRHAVPEMINSIIASRKLSNPNIHKVGTDMAVPDQHLEKIMHYYRSVLEKESISAVIFGHIGNNHLHVNMIPDSDGELARAKELYRMFAEKAVQLGGSVSAEHGIGKLKKPYLAIQYPTRYIEQMRAVKKALDPNGLMNPGTMV
jgi:D-lactate dehydrogenase (cytochrome)